MTIEYDEKGKFYTDVVSKVAIPAIIQTTEHLIRGLVHVRQGERFKDELESQSHFIAITDAVVFDENNKEVYKGPFLAVQRNQIIWIMPVEAEIQKGKEG